MSTDTPGMDQDGRTCTCHPFDNPPIPCPRKFALSACRIAALERELAAAQADFKRLHEELLSTRAAASTQAERSGYYQDMFEQKERELAAALGEVEELRKELNLTTHQLITCGVAASHPDAALSTRGAYVGKWDSQQAQEVRKLRAQCDALRVDARRWRTFRIIATSKEQWAHLMRFMTACETGNPLNVDAAIDAS